MSIGNPLDENNHVGPLIDTDAVAMYNDALTRVVEEGGSIVVEGGVLEGQGYESGCYVKPAIAEAKTILPLYSTKPLPILYLLKYSDLDEAIDMQNDVPKVCLLQL